MKALCFILLLGVAGACYWGFSQKTENDRLVKSQKVAQEKIKKTEELLAAAQKNVVDLKDRVSSVSSEKTKIKNELNKVINEFAKFKEVAAKKEKLLNDKLKVSQEKKKSVSNANVKRQMDSLKKKALVIKKKLQQIDNEIQSNSFKVRTALNSIVKVTKEHAKGWYWKSSGAKYLKPMRQLPHKYSKKKIRIVYLSKEEIRKLKAKPFIDKVAALKKQKAMYQTGYNELKKQYSKLKQQAVM
ncbi:MAG: hypothetical protein GY718_13055 [Lentisphaerae bacterium]|nr:hypothetical protein [Lentisphaerota bacterium]